MTARTSCLVFETQGTDLLIFSLQMAVTMVCAVFFLADEFGAGPRLCCLAPRDSPAGASAFVRTAGSQKAITGNFLAEPLGL